MQSAIRAALYFLALIFLIAGAIDLVGQIKADEPFTIYIPILCIGIGLGVPIILSFNPGMFSNEGSGSEDTDTSSYGDGNGSSSD